MHRVTQNLIIEVSVIQVPEKKVPECLSCLCPSEKELPERPFVTQIPLPVT
jgi:hypothetical protein